MHSRTVFFISDGTGITVETLGNSLLTQFDGIKFKTYTLRYVNTTEKAIQITKELNLQFSTEHPSYQPIIFSTIADQEIRQQLFKINAFCIDFFDKFVDPLEKELNSKATGRIGLSHTILDEKNYDLRIDAVNYALAYDDATKVTGYNLADVILLGASRSGKTPTCLYLAMQFGIKAANYPITEEDFANGMFLPAPLLLYKNKLFGLSTTADHLHAIRTKRRPNSRYASIEQCRLEITHIETLFNKEQIPFLNSAHLSIEELSTQILAKFKLKAKI